MKAEISGIVSGQTLVPGTQSITVHDLKKQEKKRKLEQLNTLVNRCLLMVAVTRDGERRASSSGQ